MQCWAVQITSCKTYVMSFYSQNIDNNQRLANAAAMSMGHNADDANYMANSMSNAARPPSLYRDNSVQNAWARDMSRGAYGHDDQSTQDYLDQARQYGIDPPSQQVLDTYRPSVYPQYGQGKRKNRKSQKKHKTRKPRKTRKSFGGKRSRKVRKTGKAHKLQMSSKSHKSARRSRRR